MADYPRTSVELRDWFTAEVACREYLQHLRWPDGVRCPDCASMKIWPTHRTRKYADERQFVTPVHEKMTFAVTLGHLMPQSGVRSIE